MSAVTLFKPSITSDLASSLIAAAERKARDVECAMCIAVCDESGVLKALLRMDGAPLMSVQVAQDKAYTAVGFGMATDEWHRFIKDDPPLSLGAPPAIDRLVIFGGGFPVVLDGAMVGGVGVSGGHYTQDMEVGQAALAFIAEKRDTRAGDK